MKQVLLTIQQFIATVLGWHRGHKAGLREWLAGRKEMRRAKRIEDFNHFVENGKTLFSIALQAKKLKDAPAATLIRNSLIEAAMCYSKAIAIAKKDPIFAVNSFLAHLSLAQIEREMGKELAAMDTLRNAMAIEGLLLDDKYMRLLKDVMLGTIDTYFLRKFPKTQSES